MRKFKVGDLVTGILEAPYVKTDRYSICKIISIEKDVHDDIEDLYDDIMVQIVHHKEHKEYTGEEYVVSSCYFRLYREPNNFRRYMYVPSR